KAAEQRRAEDSRKDEAARRAERRPNLPRRRLTLALIAGSIVVTMMFKSASERPLVARYLFITNLLTWNKDAAPGLPEVGRGELWRLVTPIFIHFTEVHILFNMPWLFALGSQLELRYGPWRLALLVVLLAVTSNLCQYFFSTVTVEGGALTVTESRPAFGGMSGVVFGLFGFVWMKAVYEPGCGLYVSPGNILLMVAWLFLCMTGQVWPIPNTAPLVGLAAGMIAGYSSAAWNDFGQPPGPDAPEE